MFFFPIGQGRQVSKLKRQKRLPGYLILFLQEQAKEFCFCTKPVTCGWIRSKCCSAQIIHLTSIQFLFWPMALKEKQVSNRSSWIPCRNVHAAFHFGILFPRNDPCSFWRDIQTGNTIMMIITGLSHLLLDFLTQSRSKDCSMSD